jgi:hypothetical protein
MSCLWDQTRSNLAMNLLRLLSALAIRMLMHFRLDIRHNHEHDTREVEYDDQRFDFMSKAEHCSHAFMVSCGQFTPSPISQPYRNILYNGPSSSQSS